MGFGCSWCLPVGVGVDSSLNGIFLSKAVGMLVNQASSKTQPRLQAMDFGVGWEVSTRVPSPTLLTFQAAHMLNLHGPHIPSIASPTVRSLKSYLHSFTILHGIIHVSVLSGSTNWSLTIWGCPYVVYPKIGPVLLLHISILVWLRGLTRYGHTYPA